MFSFSRECVSYQVNIQEYMYNITHLNITWTTIGIAGGGLNRTAAAAATSIHWYRVITVARPLFCTAATRPRTRPPSIPTSPSTVYFIKYCQDDKKNTKLLIASFMWKILSKSIQQGSVKASKLLKIRISW